MTFLPLNRGCNGELCLQLESQCEQLQLKVRTLQLDWETEQKRSMSYFNQMMELEKERDQVSVCTSSEWSLDCHSSLVPNNLYLVVSQLSLAVCSPNISYTRQTSFLCLFVLFRLFVVGTACSWSTLTVSWTRIVYVNA